MPQVASPDLRGLEPAVPAQRKIPWALIAAPIVVGLVIVAALVLFRGDKKGAESNQKVSTASQPDQPPKVAEAPKASAVPAATASAPAPAPTRAPAAVDLQRNATLPLAFPKRGADYTVVDQTELDAVFAAIERAFRDNPRARLEVGGHTSKEGAAGFNYELGQRRAEQVKRYLVGRGLPESRIVLKNYEASLPAAEGDAELDANRRVTVRLLD